MSMSDKCTDTYFIDFFKLLITFFPIFLLVTWTLQIEHMQTFSQVCLYGGNICSEISPKVHDLGTFFISLFLAHMFKDLIFTNWRKNEKED